MWSQSRSEQHVELIGYEIERNDEGGMKHAYDDDYGDVNGQIMRRNTEQVAPGGGIDSVRRNGQHRAKVLSSFILVDWARSVGRSVVSPRVTSLYSYFARSSGD